VFTGDGAAVFVYGLKYYGSLHQKRDILMGLRPKVLHLFDSFEGAPTDLCEIDQASPNVKHGIWNPGMCSGIVEKTPEEFKEIATHRAVDILGSERVKIHPGFFKETLAKIETPFRLALAHLDCEFYSSSRDVLDFLFSRNVMTDGSVVLLSCWNTNRASPDHCQRRAWRECCEKYDVKYSDEGGYGPLGHKFIIHQSPA